MTRPALQLDFQASRKRRHLAGIVVLAAAVFCGGHLVSRYLAAQDKLGRLEAVEGLLAAARPAQPAPRERAEERMKNARATARQLALPWPELIESLERSAMKEIALLHIQPDAQQRLLRLTAEARSQELMMEYLRRLNDAGGFAEVHLLSHQVREEDPLRPIQFSLQASFRSAP